METKEKKRKNLSRELNGHMMLVRADGDSGEDGRQVQL